MPKIFKNLINRCYIFVVEIRVELPCSLPPSAAADPIQMLPLPPAPQTITRVRSIYTILEFIIIGAIKWAIDIILHSRRERNPKRY